MFATITLAALLLAARTARADPNPLEPSVGKTYKEGSPCHIAWAADDGGQWKEMNIELMTGDNFDMVHLTTVATVDGTSKSNQTFDYPCPAVTPNSAIYFYQFSSPSSDKLYWTTRFAISDSAGKTTAPSEAKQSDGSPIPWGTGKLDDTAGAKPEPSSGAGNTSSISVTGSAASATSTISNSTSSTAASTSTTGGSSSSSAAGASGTSGSSQGQGGSGGNNTSANGAGAVHAHALLSLAGVAAVFAALL